MSTSTGIVAALDRLHGRARASGFLYRFTLFTRILLAAGFIPTGMVKALGHRFTVISIDNPVGMFFEAMYQTGGYWRFIGVSQIVAGILVLFPRTATLGAMMFFPIILNIFVITMSLDFRGTPFVTGPMLLAATYLLCWDWDRLRGILVDPGAPLQAPARVESLSGGWERAGYAMGGLAVLGFFFTVRGFGPPGIGAAFILMGLLGGVVALAAWMLSERRNRPPARLSAAA